MVNGELIRVGSVCYCWFFYIGSCFMVKLGLIICWVRVLVFCRGLEKKSWCLVFIEGEVSRWCLVRICCSWWVMVGVGLMIVCFGLMMFCSSGVIKGQWVQFSIKVLACCWIIGNRIVFNSCWVVGVLSFLVLICFIRLM